MAPHFAGKHIVIVGAGVGGLALAHALDKLWPSEYSKPKITIHERGPQQVDASREGYSLSIRSEDDTRGLQVLQRLGVLEAFTDDSLPGINNGKASLVFRDANWKIWGSVKPQDPPPDNLPIAQMRVMRPVLRQRLINTLPASVSAHFNVYIASARQSEKGGMQITMQNGSSSECDLLIAADGASSKIRSSLLPHDNTTFVGVVCIAATSKFPNGCPPEILGTWGPVMSGDGIGLFVFGVDDNSVVWQVSYLADKPRESVRRAHIAGQKRELLEEARRLGKNFAQPFGQLLDATDLDSLTVINAQDKPPLNHRQLGQMPVIFIGDSNHAMAPFSGSGANLALMDALDLAMLLCDPSQTFASLTTKFDEQCKARSQKGLSQSRTTINVLHSQGLKFQLYTMIMQIIFWVGGLFGS